MKEISQRLLRAVPVMDTNAAENTLCKSKEQEEVKMSDSDQTNSNHIQATQGTSLTPPGPFLAYFVIVFDCARDFVFTDKVPRGTGRKNPRLVEEERRRTVHPL